MVSIFWAKGYYVSTDIASSIEYMHPRWGSIDHVAGHAMLPAQATMSIHRWEPGSPLLNYHHALSTPTCTSLLRLSTQIGRLIVELGDISHVYSIDQLERFPRKELLVVRISNRPVFGATSPLQCTVSHLGEVRY